MDAITKLLIYSLCNDLGIVPLESAHIDVNQSLRTLNPEQAREYKRRFRKLWRQCWKQDRAVAKIDDHPSTKNHQFNRIDKKYGIGVKNPSRDQRAHRKKMVLSVIQTKVDRLKKELTPD